MVPRDESRQGFQIIPGYWEVSGTHPSLPKIRVRVKGGARFIFGFTGGGVGGFLETWIDLEFLAHNHRLP